MAPWHRERRRRLLVPSSREQEEVSCRESSSHSRRRLGIDRRNSGGGQVLDLPRWGSRVLEEEVGGGRAFVAREKARRSALAYPHRGEALPDSRLGGLTCPRWWREIEKAGAPPVDGPATGAQRGRKRRRTRKMANCLRGAGVDARRIEGCRTRFKGLSMNPARSMCFSVSLQILVWGLVWRPGWRCSKSKYTRCFIIYFCVCFFLLLQEIM